MSLNKWQNFNFGVNSRFNSIYCYQLKSKDIEKVLTNKSCIPETTLTVHSDLICLMCYSYTINDLMTYILDLQVSAYPEPRPIKP